MKKMLIFAALLFATAAMSQEVKFKLPQRDTLRQKAEFKLPDSMSHMMPWKPEYASFAPKKTRPLASATSVVVIPEDKRRTSVMVLDNNTLYVGPHVIISNGQAWNWNPARNNTFNRSPFPDAHLDARTLSFPMRR